MTRFAVVVAHTHEPAVPPSKVAEVDVPEALDALILACLDKDPASRPQTADEVARAVEDIGLADRWTPERARRWWDTHHPQAEKR